MERSSEIDVARKLGNDAARGSTGDIFTVLGIFVLSITIACCYKHLSDRCLKMIQKEIKERTPEKVRKRAKKVKDKANAARKRFSHLVAMGPAPTWRQTSVDRAADGDEENAIDNYKREEDAYPSVQPEGSERESANSSTAVPSSSLLAPKVQALSGPDETPSYTPNASVAAANKAEKTHLEETGDGIIKCEVETDPYS